MKFYIPFGDWSDDGHGHYTNVLVAANSMQDVLNAEDRIRDNWGKSFFDGFANDYAYSSLSPTVWEALIANNMPIEILTAYDDVNDWTGCHTIQEALDADTCPALGMEFIEQAFIWLLNKYGAGIVILPEEEEIPQINNWTCPGFESVGYGCWED